MAAVLARAVKNGATFHDYGSSPQSAEPVYLYSRRRGLLGSSYALFYIVTFSLNTVAVAAGVLSQYNFHQVRRGYHYYWMDSWYLVNAIFATIHILAALYIVKKIEDPIDTVPHHDYALPQTAAVLSSPINPAYVAAPGVPPPPPVFTNGYVTVERPVTQPESYARMKEVLCENKIFAAYILVFVAYFVWHHFFDVRSYHQGMHFVMRCADLFIATGPASFVFCSILVLLNRREI